MMLSSLIRFMSYGWIKKLYIDPYHFTYYGFSNGKPWNYSIYFFYCRLAALFIAIDTNTNGCFAPSSFTYIELMDKLPIWIIIITHNQFCIGVFYQQTVFSVDAIPMKNNRFQKNTMMEYWYSKITIGCHFHAGLAKLNSDSLKLFLKNLVTQQPNLPL
jgi:hypothetical protein